jgi:magnesium transporter
MRLFHIHDDQFTELHTAADGSLPAMPPSGYLWLGLASEALEQQIAVVQSALQHWTGGSLVDLHITDLLNPQLPSHFDYTSWYDLLVFRRLAAGSEGCAATQTQQSTRVDTSPVGFAVFDRVLLTVHPAGCLVREFFVNRLQQQTHSIGSNAGANATRDNRSCIRLPPSPTDMALRMVNHMVDSYLDLRRLFTKQLDQLQQELFSVHTRPASWKRLFDSRNSLHLLEDTCEDQRDAITEWIDAQDELPTDANPSVMRERELLRVRARDVLEHIERVLSHIRRLESSSENAVQMYFATQSNRTNNIMRVLTVLTAIFMPLNLVTGFFGMNFEGLPLIHSARGFWWTLGFMLLLGAGLSLFFWRKRYLSSSH